ncbi:hypothetical protein DFQ28_010306 [Apophysomyces sp. BC1034]|nr:hypothetical protein DFQ28_010306 [Apophysomyces sp. BC1034]
MEQQAMMSNIQAMLELLKAQQEEIKVLLQEAATRKMPMTIELVPPEVFRGERSLAKAEEWVHVMDKYGELTELNDRQRVLFACTLFRDAAINWWRYLEATIDKTTGENIAPKTWREFKEAFRKEFAKSPVYRITQ